MIAKITRGNRPGDIAAYLHGPGHANEHEFSDANGERVSGGVVISSNIGMVGDTDPTRWAPRMRKAIAQRPEAARPVWQVSLRNTINDRTLTDVEWADVASEFIERMGLDEHPWVAVRHGDDHIHIVASRVADDGTLWSGSHDRRHAQRACTALEKTWALEQAPRRKEAPKAAVRTLRADARARVQSVADWRQIDARAGRRLPREMGLEAAKRAAKSIEVQGAFSLGEGAFRPSSTAASASIREQSRARTHVKSEPSPEREGR